MTRHFLLIPRLQIHNANALSSPYTIGFPAITAWLGAVHALERRLKHRDASNRCATAYFEENDYDDALEDVEFNSVAVACHQVRMHTYRGANDYVSSLVGTGNPLDKSGKRPSFIEEARCDLTVSLLIEYEMDDNAHLVDAVSYLLNSMKMAGGDVIRFGTPELHTCKQSVDRERQSLLARLMPANCLVERRDLMESAMQEGQEALDALLDYLVVHHRCEAITEGEKETINWTSQRKTTGWVVPIATGFYGVSDLGHAEHQRDQDTPHRFVESVVTLGQFIMPYRIMDLDHILWHYAYNDADQLYVCKPNKPYSNLLDSQENAHG